MSSINRYTVMLNKYYSSLVMSHVSRDRYGDKRKSGSDSKFDFNRFELYSALITWSTSKENRSESRSLSIQSEGAIFFRLRHSVQTCIKIHISIVTSFYNILYAYYTILYLHITIFSHALEMEKLCFTILVVEKGLSPWPLVTNRDNTIKIIISIIILIKKF